MDDDVAAAAVDTTTTTTLKPLKESIRKKFTCKKCKSKYLNEASLHKHIIKCSFNANVEKGSYTQLYYYIISKIDLAIEDSS